MDAKQDREYTVEEAAEFLKVTPGTLANWRSNGGGPTFYKPGSRIFYLQSDLDIYKQSRRFNSTAEYGGVK